MRSFRRTLDFLTDGSSHINSVLWLTSFIRHHQEKDEVSLQMLGILVERKVRFLIYDSISMISLVLPGRSQLSARGRALVSESTYKGNHDEIPKPFLVILLRELS